mmetsp:Transcript_2225/g.4949  ORF Transcript_2225/g.4949 Transcript_2225/m.4949 type:complete len:210 (-) Transcript_2225:1246-1875(-)
MIHGGGLSASATSSPSLNRDTISTATPYSAATSLSSSACNAFSSATLLSLTSCLSILLGDALSIRSALWLVDGCLPLLGLLGGIGPSVSRRINPARGSLFSAFIFLFMGLSSSSSLRGLSARALSLLSSAFFTLWSLSCSFFFSRSSCIFLCLLSLSSSSFSSCSFISPCSAFRVLGRLARSYGVWFSSFSMVGSARQSRSTTIVCRES